MKVSINPLPVQITARYTGTYLEKIIHEDEFEEITHLVDIVVAYNNITKEAEELRFFWKTHPLDVNEASQEIKNLINHQLQDALFITDKNTSVIVCKNLK